MSTFSKWRDGPYYTKDNRIDNKVVIVTGANTGIGKETALELANRGARVYMACRNFEKCEEARQEIIASTGNKNVFNFTLDLSSLQSVRDFVEAFLKHEKRLDILINNGGIMNTPRQLTVDGFEQQFAVNHLGHFLLTNLLLDVLKASAPSRIVVVSSDLHKIGKIHKEDINSEKHYCRLGAYGQSKLANVLFTRKLAEKLKESNVTVNCLHPGVVQTEISRNDALMGAVSNMFSKLYRTTKGGAQTTIFLALDPDIEGATGGYYDSLKLVSPSCKAKNEEMADWLWQESAKMVGLQSKSD